MTTKWSDPAVCFNGKRPAEIPEGARVQTLSGYVWQELYTPWWLKTTKERPITYRYELPPVETEPFATTFNERGKRESSFCLSDDGKGWEYDAKVEANMLKGTVRFYDKHGNQVEPEALEEADI